MVRPGVPETAPRHPDHHRSAVRRAPPPVSHFGRVVDQLIEAGGDEVVELHLADRPLAGDRGADTNAQHRTLAERRVDQPIAEFLDERLQQQKRVAVVSADVFAVHEHARIGAQRIADAEHHAFEKRPALRVDGRRRLDLSTSDRRGRGARRGILLCALGAFRSQSDRRVQHFHVFSRWLVREHPDASLRRLGPRRLDHRSRLGLHNRFGLVLEALDVAGLDDAFFLQALNVQRDRIARGPVLIELAVRVALVRQRGNVP